MGVERSRGREGTRHREEGLKGPTKQSGGPRDRLTLAGDPIASPLRGSQ
jgi:hypothetical protein